MFTSSSSGLPTQLWNLTSFNLDLASVTATLGPDEASLLLSYSVASQALTCVLSSSMRIVSFSLASKMAAPTFTAGDQRLRSCRAAVSPNCASLGIGTPWFFSPASSRTALLSCANSVMLLNLDSGTVLWDYTVGTSDRNALRVVAAGKDAVVVWVRDSVSSGSHQVVGISWTNQLLWRTGFVCDLCVELVASNRSVVWACVRLDFASSFKDAPIVTKVPRDGFPDHNTDICGNLAFDGGLTLFTSWRYFGGGSFLGADTFDGPLWSIQLADSLEVDAGVISPGGTLWVVTFDTDPKYYLKYDSPVS